MLDLFTIFGKGGIVLWYFQGTENAFTSSVNALIKSVILQERGGGNAFSHEALTLKYKLDNEFELIFVVAYQKILQLSYVDKLLNDIQMEFRNKYKDDLQQGKLTRNFEFSSDFTRILESVEAAFKAEAKAPRQMRRFDESSKSKKTVGADLIVRKDEPGKGKKKKGGQGDNVPEPDQKKPSPKQSPKPSPPQIDDKEAEIQKNIERMKNKMNKKPSGSNKSPAPAEPQKKAKSARKWEMGGTTKDHQTLDFSSSKDNGTTENGDHVLVNAEEQSFVGQMGGDLGDLEPESSSDEEEEVVEKSSKKSSGGFGFLSGLKNLVGQKALTQEDIAPALEKMKDHLIGKNVAAEISDKLCNSVATKLEGRVLGTFNTVAATVKKTLHESCVQILSPRRRIDILRDVMEVKQQRRPYVITFCGVNGVGKSTNLAKVCFWLVENRFRVLIAACDTFRAGAVEQLRTHIRKLNALHPAEAHNGQKMVHLYEKGYGKDAAGIAMEAVNHARDMRFDVVLVDTAGRMQDNEPLMRALSKLIKINQPDLVLFVGEALVGNEAVDQLTKFNQALADHSNMAKPRLIDGIVLTKFDTIDDKVGAAISMTYTTGQPIVFVGTGQTYTDLKNLNAKAVVHALLK